MSFSYDAALFMLIPSQKPDNVEVSVTPIGIYRVSCYQLHAEIRVLKGCLPRFTASAMGVGIMSYGHVFLKAKNSVVKTKHHENIDTGSSYLRLVL